MLQEKLNPKDYSHIYVIWYFDSRLYETVFDLFVMVIIELFVKMQETVV